MNKCSIAVRFGESMTADESQLTVNRQLQKEKKPVYQWQWIAVLCVIIAWMTHLKRFVIQSIVFVVYA